MVRVLEALTPVGLRWLPGAALAVARRPDLWVTAARQAVALAPRGWATRPPFLPLPSRAYFAFRMETAYGGDGSTPPDPHDLVTYLSWCRRMRALQTR